MEGNWEATFPVVKNVDPGRRNMTGFGLWLFYLTTVWFGTIFWALDSSYVKWGWEW